MALTAACSLFIANAQLPKWMIPPTNDTIYIKVDYCLLQTIENGKSSLWTMDGQMLYSTSNTILPFKDGVATVINAREHTIKGLVDTVGKFTGLPDISIAYDNPYFENGFLIGKDKDSVVFYKKDGTKAKMPYAVKAYPFHRGFAPYLTYDQIEKKKGPHYAYYKANGDIRYVITDDGESKSIDPKNIDFLSGIGTNGKGVAVIKNKLYWFVPETESFEPFLCGTEESEKKRHLSLAKDYEEYFLNLPSDSIVIQAKYGKNKMATLKFNNELLPSSFSFDDEDNLIFEVPKEKTVDYSSQISIFGNDPFGLSVNSKQALPAQFKNVGRRYGNKAFVKLNDKWGVVEIIPDLKYSLKINKGEDVAFRHQKFETQIRLDLPVAISAKDARIDIPEKTGCLIDKTSRETKDTESGNYVIYNCVLNIPESLPDTITSITYSPVTVSYDGIRLFEIPLSVKAWHLKYYNVDPIDSETSITNGIASFTININAQKNVGENDYPFEVKIEADDVNVEYEKLSETRYKCMVSNLKEGDNNLNIIVTEKGCPPSVFPFELFYTKPVRKKKEAIIVRKKTPEVRKHTPRLEI